ncbi:MAG TPA: hypothetical protein PKY77_10880 [Phycisphaerae bacterium]|nr:hypothetical protein [Phycisphaerae bacterium]HRY70085.1 hypothetical protein [Phycisphaerae bacterium]HSA27361.1 hypothetical protein [Phycisphaerae bacterium]
MTTHNYIGRETVDLLERILDRVESIDKNVEDLLDHTDGRFGDFTYRNGYDGQLSDCDADQ